MSSIQELRAAVSPSLASAGADKSPAPANKAPARGSSGPLGLLVLAAALGICAGIAVDRFALPHGPALPSPAAVLPQAAAEGGALASGTFVQPDPNNPLSHGTGGVSVHDREVVLGEDFAVTPGPDYRVLLVPKPAIRAAADVANTMYVDLGPLTAFKGGQHYPVPAGVDLANYPSIVIWCRTYAALISTADLSFGKAGN